jgi:hypothetical protein
MHRTPDLDEAREQHFPCNWFYMLSVLTPEDMSKPFTDPVLPEGLFAPVSAPPV